MSFYQLPFLLGLKVLGLFKAQFEEYYETVRISVAMPAAKKTSPKLWEKAKAKAKRKMGGHSARAMQLAVKYYKDMGGKYSGAKSSSNSLSKWGKEDWQTREEYESKGKKAAKAAKRHKKKSDG